MRQSCKVAAVVSERSRSAETSSPPPGLNALALLMPHRTLVLPYHLTPTCQEVQTRPEELQPGS